MKPGDGRLRQSHHHLLLLVFLIVTITSIRSTLSSPIFKHSLGISPQDLIYFKSDVIKCKDGSNKFTQSQLNDDFCDCSDGTDEPGTSACPLAKFYCKNAGHSPLILFSSRVNDGICDCCDGSDEYDGRVNCSNTCWEAGKVARDKLKKKIATYEEGVTVRNREVEQAKKAIAKDEAELSKLQGEEKILKKLVEQLKERKDQIEKAEEKERLEKEKEEKKKRESEEKVDDQIKDPTEKHEETVDAIGNLDSPPVEQHGVEEDTVMDEAESLPDADSEVSTNEAVKQHVVEEEDSVMVEAEDITDSESVKSTDEAVKQEKDDSDKTEELSKEELGRLVASRWTGENTEQKTDDIDDTKSEVHEISQSTSALEGEDSDGGYASEEDQKYDEHKYDDDDDEVEDEYVEENHDEENHDDSTSSYTPENYDPIDDYSDVSETSNLSWLEKIQKTVRNMLNSVNLFQTPVNISDSAHVKKEYDDSNSKLSKIQSRISSLSEKLKQDFGVDKEFYSFYGRCFENKENKYVYKVCPFKQASQVEGHSTTRLGEWEKFDDSHKVMVFSNGDKCWNGPDRSLKVKLRCGLKNELTDVDEPSRCEYVALLATPALCVEERLKDLRDKLDRMNTEQPQNHDEL